MKKSIVQELGTMNQLLLGYTAEMLYDYSLLPVKADPTLLLSITFDDDGTDRKVEDLATVILHDQEGDDDKLDLIPKGSNAQIAILADGVAEAFPQIKQSIEYQEEMDPESEMEIREEMEKECGELPPDEKQAYLRLTMPEVDDDRRKFLEDAVKVIHDATKAQMDAAFTCHSAVITSLLVGEDAATVKEVTDTVEKVRKQYDDMRENMTDDKKKEIEEGNVKYHSGQEEKARADSNDDAWNRLKMET